MTTQTQTTVSDLQIFATRQALNGVCIDRNHYPQLRATIERDAHDFQSHARVEAWTTDAGWKTIHELPIRALPIGAYSYSYGNVKPDYYPRTALGREGLPFWTETMHHDLLSLLEYGRRFYA